MRDSQLIPMHINYDLALVAAITFFHSDCTSKILIYICLNFIFPLEMITPLMQKDLLSHAVNFKSHCHLHGNIPLSTG